MCGGNNQSIISALGERFRFFMFPLGVSFGKENLGETYYACVQCPTCPIRYDTERVRWTDFQSCSLPAQLNYNNDCWTVCNSTSSQTNGVLPTIITLFHRKWSAILIKAVTPKTLIIVWWPNVRAHQGARVNITFQRWMQHLNVSTALVRRMKLKVVGLTLFICT